MSREDKSILRVENFLLELLLKFSRTEKDFDIHPFRMENILFRLCSTWLTSGREFSSWILLQVYARLQATKHTLGGYCHRKRWSRIWWWKSSTSIFRVESFLLKLFSAVIRCGFFNAFSSGELSPRTQSFRHLFASSGEHTPRTLFGITTFGWSGFSSKLSLRLNLFE